MADTVTVLIPAKYHDPLAGPWPWEEVEAQVRPWCVSHNEPIHSSAGCLVYLSLDDPDETACVRGERLIVERP